MSSMPGLGIALLFLGGPVTGGMFTLVGAVFAFVLGLLLPLLMFILLPAAISTR